ncbi:MAG: glycosyltransferase family 39 protein [Solirubrobacteraceae bacterium]
MSTSLAGTTKDHAPGGTVRGDRRAWGIVMVLTVLSGCLRAVPIGTAPIWYDETYSLRVIDPSAAGSLWTRVGDTESTPPLFYALSAGVRALGVDGVVSIRLVSVLAAAAAVVVAFWAARQFFAVRVAVVAALVTAAHPMVSAFAIDGRSYSLLLLVAFGLTGLLGRLLRRADRRTLVAWAVLATVGCWTHYFAGLLVVVATLLVLLMRPNARKGLLLATAGWGILCLPLLSLLSRQGADERAQFIGSRGLVQRSTMAGRELLGGSPNVSNAVEGLALALAVVLVLLALIAATRGAERPVRGQVVAPELVLFALAAATTLVPLVLGLVSERLDRFFARNLIVVLPAVVMLLAAGGSRRRLLPRVALCGLVALMLLSSGLVLYDWRYGQSDVPGALDRAGPSVGLAPVLTNEVSQVVLPFLLQRGAPKQALGVTTDRLEVLLAPARNTTRTFQAVPVPPAIAHLKGLGFKVTVNTLYHGVRRLRLCASTPIAVPAGAFAPLGVLLPAPVVDPGLQGALLGREWGHPVATTGC